VVYDDLVFFRRRCYNEPADDERSPWLSALRGSCWDAVSDTEAGEKRGGGVRSSQATYGGFT